MGIRIPNHRFSYATYGNTRLRLEALIGDQTVYFDTAYRNPDSPFESVLSVGDRIKLGPSTHLDSSGATENVIVESIPSGDGIDNVTLTEVLSNNYSDDDPVSFVGTQCAGGWFKNGNLSAYELETVGLGGEEGDGEASRRGQVFSQDNSSTPTVDRFEALLPDGSLESGVSYKLGVVHKFTGTADWIAGFAKDGTTYPGNYVSLIDETSNDSAFAITESPETSMTVNGRKNQRVFLAPNSGKMEGVISCVWAHYIPASVSTGTDYEIPVAVDLGSLKVTPIRSGDSIKQTGGHSLTSYNHEGHEGFHERYVIEARFTNVADSIYKNLQKLETLCRQGKSLTLKSSIPDLPTVLYGTIEIKGFSHETLDIGLASFDFVFISE